MHIAITGATGFVGRQVLAVCARFGHRVTALTRTNLNLPNAVVTGPLEQLPPSQVLPRADAVLHLAARAHVMNEKAAAAASAYYAANVVGTRNLLEAAIASGIRRFVFMSSIKAVAERSADGRPICAETDPHPEDEYGKSKLDAEYEVRRRCEAAGIEWVILRPPLVLGAQASGNLLRLEELVRKGVPLPLASVRNRRSLVLVETLAEAAVRACEAPGAANRILMPFDITLSTPELLARIASASGAKLRLFSVPVPLLRLAGTLAGRRAEMDRLCTSLEISPDANLIEPGRSADTLQPLRQG